MRSELPWLESRSPWQRFGPTLLGLSIIGVGMGGAIRIVKAQDKTNPPSVSTQVDVTVARQSADTDPTATQEDRTTTREIESLLDQRAKLDARIAELRQRVRSTDPTHPGTRAETRPGARRDSVDPTSQERKRAMDDARQQARDAMQQAREAMRQAAQALREAQRAEGRIDGNKGTFNIPTMPKFNFDFNKNSDLFNKNFDPRASTVDPEAMKRLQEQLHSLNSQEWAQKWKELQPQIEQQMRDFQQRMQEWQRSFEAQQRAMQKQLQEQFRNSDSFKKLQDLKLQDFKELKDLKELKELDETKSSDPTRNKATDGDNDKDNEPL
jgi:hypothetical protein